MYKVVKFFVDLQDNNHPYKPDDTFPRAGKEVTEERLAELASDKNKQGCPLIVKEAEAAEGKSVDKMTVAELQAYAKEKEIDLAGATAKADILAKIKEAEAAE